MPAIQSLVLIMLAFLIGCVAGSVTRSFLRIERVGDTDKTKPADLTLARADIAASMASATDLKLDAEGEKKAAAADIKGERPKLLAAPLGRGKDDLKLVNGICSVSENKLNALGIFHFEQIASWKPKEADWVDEFLALSGRIDHENWVDQAKLLAAREETSFPS